MAKTGPGDLKAVLDILHQENSSASVLVGFENADDAGIVKIDDNHAIVFTADIISPLVDDPFVFGQIAAANAISDIYAMGGTPLSALNLGFFPNAEIKNGTVNKIMAGGLDILKKCGVFLLGGHTVKDDNLKYGLAVIGNIHPTKFYANNMLQPGCDLILTKAIGTGLGFVARKNETISENEYQQAVNSMIVLNNISPTILSDYHVVTLTDITGFGLLGHLDEMLVATRKTMNNIGAKIYYHQLPQFSYVQHCLQQGMSTKTCSVIKKSLKTPIHRDNFSEQIMTVLCDPQTSGGLLIAVWPEYSSKLLQKIQELGFLSASIIGRTIEENSIFVE